MKKLWSDNTNLTKKICSNIADVHSNVYEQYFETSSEE